jgi:chromosome segregation ATPase
MLNSSLQNNKSNPQGKPAPKRATAMADDFFNKKKIAEEAKRDTEAIRRNQQEIERKKIQVEINNLERGLDQFLIQLRVKENMYIDTKRKADDAKKAVFLLDNQIKKQEGGMGYLDDEATSQDRREGAFEVELDKARQEVIVAERERASFEAELNKDRANLADIENRISRLNDELSRLMAEEDTVKREVARDEDDIRSKKTEKERLIQAARSVELASSQVGGQKSRVVKNIEAREKEIKQEKQELFLNKRVADQLDRDSEVMAREVEKLKREKEAKEREIMELKRKKGSI